jgi:hypothetical protein
MTVLITLTIAGANTGPFNLYSNVDGFVSPFASGVSKAALLAGYTSTVVPLGTTTIRVVSFGECTNTIDISVITTTTTTTTVAPSIYTYSVKLDADSIANVCDQTPVTVYSTSNAFVPGAPLYSSVSPFVILSGYIYVSDVADGIIYNLDSVTGIVGSDTGSDCL